jgi:hypothetical protein
VVPFVYIGFLRNHTISNANISYHFKGEYNANQLIEYVEELEILFDKRFLKFKKLLDQFDKDSEGDLRKHAEVIDSILFCIKLNGRKKLAAFWDTSDAFLKVIILLLPVIGVNVVLISYFYFGVSGLVLSLIPVIIILPLILVIFSYFLRFSRYIFRKRGKAIPALSLALFAVDALIDRKVVRSFDKIRREYFYYTEIHKYNNLVNEDAHIRGVVVQTSSSIYGNLKELAGSDK